MSKDLRPILAGWDHDPDDFQVRIITGDDGRDKLQMRLDLGLLQMELDGRPDGKTPYGSTSLLDYHESQVQKLNSHNNEYALEASDCEELMREGIQYYHRYVALFHLGRYDLVARDTERNLRLFDFVHTHAVRERDKVAFEQYRPYVIMMHGRALAHLALDRNDHKTALNKIDESITAIRTFYRDSNHPKRIDTSQEIMLLRELRREIDRDRRSDPVERLDDQLSHAIAREDYEEAARVRDQIRRLRQTNPLGQADRSSAS